MTSRTILITGAGTGIGRDTASALVARGHTVYATTHSESEVAGLQQALGAAATVFKLDITSAEDRARIADLDVDVLINNAAVARSGSLAEVDPKTTKRRERLETSPHLLSNNSAFQLQQQQQQETLPSAWDTSPTKSFDRNPLHCIRQPLQRPYCTIADSTAASAQQCNATLLDISMQLNVGQPPTMNPRVSRGTYHTYARQSRIHIGTTTYPGGNA